MPEVNTSRRIWPIRMQRSNIFATPKRNAPRRRFANFGCGIAIEDYRTILDEPDVEVVSICTPNNVHASITIDCLRAGKHVLCEKPAARTYAEALEVQRVQQETRFPQHLFFRLARFTPIKNTDCFDITERINGPVHIATNFFRAQCSLDQ